MFTIICDKCGKQINLSKLIFNFPYSNSVEIFYIDFGSDNYACPYFEIECVCGNKYNL